MANVHPQFTELLIGLPHDIGLDCLSRLPYTSHEAASRVCRRWCQLLRSQDFYYHRQRSGFTRNVACLVQSLPTKDKDSTDGRKSGSGPPTYGITVFDPMAGTWSRLETVPYPNGLLPLFCQLASCEGKLVVMGGWDPVSYDPLTDVFIYDFTTSRWEKRAPMPSKRSFFAAAGCSSRGRIYVAGGHDENKNALGCAWAYDMRDDKWTELAPMGQPRDECEGVVVGQEFWVVSGYGTDNQGKFEESVEAYSFNSGEWRRVNRAWRQTQCPRSCVGVSDHGELISWNESVPTAGVGTCGVSLGSQGLVTGAQYQGGPCNFYMARPGEGQDRQYEILTVPDEFSGYVQSGCCVQI